MRITIALTLAVALAGCGEDAPGPAAKAFNAERKAIDVRDAAALRTRIVKPPRAANGGYAAMPSDIDPSGERPGPSASPVPDAGRAVRTAAGGVGYLLVPGSAEPPALDPAREAALRRPDPRRRAEIAERIAEADKRRRAVIAAQAKAAGRGGKQRSEALRRSDAQAFKSYRPPTAVRMAPSKGTATAGKPTPRPTGTPRTR